MAHQHNSFLTEGTAALKVDQHEFDVFAKPRFASAKQRAAIIDFDDAKLDAREVHTFEFSACSSRKAFPHFASQLLEKLRNDHILGDLFVSKRGNGYRKADLALFAKGFTLTGLATFVAILFGA